MKKLFILATSVLLLSCTAEEIPQQIQTAETTQTVLSAPLEADTLPDWLIGNYANSNGETAQITPSQITVITNITDFYLSTSDVDIQVYNSYVEVSFLNEMTLQLWRHKRATQIKIVHINHHNYGWFNKL